MARSVSSNVVRAKVFVVGLSVMIALASALTILMVALVSSKQAEAAFPGTNGRIVFDSDRASPSGHSELYTMNPDGSDRDASPSRPCQRVKRCFLF
jgi:hypothetical protein